jgi:hypothetical protein
LVFLSSPCAVASDSAIRIPIMQVVVFILITWLKPRSPMRGSQWSV